MERRNAWKVYDQTELEKLDKINETYKNCLDDGKTERECITLAVKKAEAAWVLDLKKQLPYLEVEDGSGARDAQVSGAVGKWNEYLRCTH